MKLTKTIIVYDDEENQFNNYIHLVPDNFSDFISFGYNGYFYFYEGSDERMILTFNINDVIFDKYGKIIKAKKWSIIKFYNCILCSFEYCLFLFIERVILY